MVETLLLYLFLTLAVCAFMAFIGFLLAEWGDDVVGFTLGLLFMFFGAVFAVASTIDTISKILAYIL